MHTAIKNGDSEKEISWKFFYIEIQIQNACGSVIIINYQMHKNSFKEKL